LVINIELAAPLGPAELGLQGFVFNDWGSLWSSSAAQDPKEGHRVIGDDFFMRTTIGLGVRWQSPFGLLGFSFGWPLRKNGKVDKTQVFRFSFGTDF
jgi:outer membrane protein insertion porin family